ncbi:MAG: phosphatidylglycerophosphatase A [Verrucomicrobiota bacterium]|nr:phosphatidylglycerophosphatase A [Verrucomicrobiota bacterium]
MDPDDRISSLDRFATLVAQGFGVGKIQIAPGTFGTLLGYPLLALLLLTQNWVCWWLGLGGMALLAVWTSSVAERVLRHKDPGSVVIDEIVAMPLCLAAFLYFESAGDDGVLMKPREVFSLIYFPVLAAHFILFRIFDIWKPWPVRQSQRLPNGWGITVDDLLAALYVNLCYFGWVRFGQDLFPPR